MLQPAYISWKAPSHVSKLGIGLMLSLIVHLVIVYLLLMVSSSMNETSKDHSALPFSVRLQSKPYKIPTPVLKPKPGIRAEKLVSDSMALARQYEFWGTGEEEFINDTLSYEKNVTIFGSDEKTLENNKIVEIPLPHGSLKLKIHSWFGGIQCFEVYEPDLFDDLVEGKWMFRRC